MTINSPIKLLTTLNSIRHLTICSNKLLTALNLFRHFTIQFSIQQISILPTNSLRISTQSILIKLLTILNQTPYNLFKLLTALNLFRHSQQTQYRQSDITSNLRISNKTNSYHSSRLSTQSDTLQFVLTNSLQLSTYLDTLQFSNKLNTALISIRHLAILPTNSLRISTQ